MQQKQRGLGVYGSVNFALGLDGVGVEGLWQEVEIESIRKMLARAADTGRSN